MKPEFEYFTIYDSKVGNYRKPILAINRHEVLRELDTLFRDPEQQKNQLVVNAEDFQLFKCGEFSMSTGVMTGTHLEHIANLHEIKTSVMQSTAQNSRSRDVSPSSPVLNA